MQTFLSELAENNSLLRGPLMGLMELSKYGMEHRGEKGNSTVRPEML